MDYFVDTLSAPFWLLATVLGLLGAIAGSFATAAIYRIPHPEKGLLHPRRSQCPTCGSLIRWFDNLPLLSYVVLGGRCRSCSESVGAGYLLTELVVVALFLLAGLTWPGGEPVRLVLSLVVITALVIATVIDWNHFILPDGITLGGIPFGFAASILAPEFQGVVPGENHWVAELLGFDFATSPHLAAALSAAVGCSSAWLLLLGTRALFSAILKEEALGLGDVKLLAAVGALFGLDGVGWTVLLGVLLGSALGIANIVRMTALIDRRSRRRGRPLPLRAALRKGWWHGRRIPFGPPLALGAGLYLVVPELVRSFFLVTWPSLLTGRVHP